MHPRLLPPPRADVAYFDVPRTLKVGTLDSLMAVSEDAGRADAYMEGVARKVERQVAESYLADKLAELAKAGKDVSATGIEPLSMYVPGPDRSRPVPVGDWAASFRWDASAWGDAQDSLPDILRRLQAAAEKIDADIRVYAQAYAERKGAYLATERKKT